MRVEYKFPVIEEPLPAPRVTHFPRARRAYPPPRGAPARCYRPMNRGGLFSRRARAPSAKSSEENGAARNASRSSEVNKSSANSALMLRMLSGAFPAHRCATSTASSMPPGRLIPHATDSSRSNRIPARSMARARPDSRPIHIRDDRHRCRTHRVEQLCERLEEPAPELVLP